MQEIYIKKNDLKLIRLISFIKLLYFSIFCTSSEGLKTFRLKTEITLNESFDFKQNFLYLNV
jgi:hypothetical protein